MARHIEEIAPYEVEGGWASSRSARGKFVRCRGSYSGSISSFSQGRLRRVRLFTLVGPRDDHEPKRR